VIAKANDDDRRRSDRERKRTQRAADKDVVIRSLTPDQLEWRKLLELDDEEWLRFFFPDLFWYTFTPQQKVMIQAIGEAITHGGDQAVAASRGEGKTTLFECLLLKYCLQGVVRFAVLFGATGAHAEASLETIKAAITENQQLSEYYPEVCDCVTALEDTPNRAHYQTVSGRRMDTGEEFAQQRNKFSWCGPQIVFPSVPGSPSAGAIIATRGLDAAVRGLKKLGRRPDVVGIDDPDTDETVGNPDTQGRKLVKRIDHGIGALGGQQRRVARVMLTTLQSRNCPSAWFTDPQVKPAWSGKRFRFLIKPPTRIDLWEQYQSLRKANQQAGDKLATGAHAFYVEHRSEMDAGAEVANPNRYNPEIEASALEFYFNEVADKSLEYAQTELDNDPPATLEGSLSLTSYRVRTECRSGTDHRIVPDSTKRLCIGGDVKKLGLHWVAIAFDERAVGSIVDYNFWRFDTEGRKPETCETLILEGLHAWWDWVRTGPFKDDSGEVWDPDYVLVDRGWKEEGWNAQPVIQWAATVGRFVMPSKGIPNYRRPQQTKLLQIGDNLHIDWRTGQPLAEINADHFKLRVQEGFLADFGVPGSLGLYNPRLDHRGRDDSQQFQRYSEHIVSEEWDAGKGKFKPPHGENHYLDATALARAAAVIGGLSVNPAPQVKPKPRPTPQPVAQAQSQGRPYLASNR
jgi:hypothetical protein